MSRKFEKRRAAMPKGAEGERKMIAIVGRPNVGKSTLFNRLAGRRLAIVEDIPGVTRDRQFADGTVLGRECVFIDTGGFDPDSDHPMNDGIVAQIRVALEECDVILCVFDAMMDPTTADRKAVSLLRESTKPIIFVANKADNKNFAMQANAYYELGVDEVIPLSASHGHGMTALEEKLSEAMGESKDDQFETIDEEIPRVTIVGRPNAGKSSLINYLTGEQRQLVTSIPGTTIDSVDSLIEYKGRQAVFVDTAGMRRKRAVKKERGIEGLSVYRAIRSLDRCDVAVIMIDGEEGVSEQDAKIVGLAISRGAAIVIGLNKMDLLPHGEIKKRKRRTFEVLKFATWAKIVPMSAKTGRGASPLIDAIFEATASHRRRAKTAEVNRFFEEVLVSHPPPIHKGKAVRFKYITQVSTAPPTFVIMTNAPDAIHFSYQRFVINQIRERWDFSGTPIRVHYRKARGRAHHPTRRRQKK